MSGSHMCSLICHFLVLSLQFISFWFSWFILLLGFQIFESEFPICLLFFLFTDTSVTVTLAVAPPGEGSGVGLQSGSGGPSVLCCSIDPVLV